MGGQNALFTTFESFLREECLIWTLTFLWPSRWVAHFQGRPSPILLVSPPSGHCVWELSSLPLGNPRPSWGFLWDRTLQLSRTPQLPRKRPHCNPKYGQEAHGEGEEGKLIPFSPFWNFHKVPSQSVALTGGAGRTAVLFTQLLQEGRFVLQLPGESRGTAEQLGILSPPPQGNGFQPTFTSESCWPRCQCGNRGSEKWSNFAWNHAISYVS